MESFTHPMLFGRSKQQFSILFPPCTKRVHGEDTPFPPSTRTDCTNDTPVLVFRWFQVYSWHFLAQFLPMLRVGGMWCLTFQHPESILSIGMCQGFLGRIYWQIFCQILKLVCGAAKSNGRMAIVVGWGQPSCPASLVWWLSPDVGEWLGLRTVLFRIWDVHQTTKHCPSKSV